MVPIAAQQTSYQVLIKEGPFELRLYEPMLIVSCREPDLGGGYGFRRLFNFISGNNQADQKISMTAPVINYPSAGQPAMAFVMPSQYDLYTVPQPNDPELEVVAFPARRVAAVRFSGRVSEAVIQRRTAELRTWLETRLLKTAGDPALARYNPPFVPGLFKRNEVWIEIRAD